MNAQSSTLDQLKATRDLATKAGLYDAADWLKNHIDNIEGGCQRNPEWCIKDFAHSDGCSCLPERCSTCDEVIEVEGDEGECMRCTNDV